MTALNSEHRPRRCLRLPGRRSSPKIALNDLDSLSDEDEQEGYKFIIGGSVRGIRNPKGHEYDIRDTPDQCLDYLALASLLLRRLEDAGSLTGTCQ
jgi:uncharacterized protein (TIGR02391 family)